jgi:prevent-host-death family protein
MPEREHVNVHAAKTHLSKLLERVENGEEIVIDRAGKPVALLTRVPEQPRPRRQAGALKGQIWMADDFDDDLPADILAAFNGEHP